MRPASPARERLAFHADPILFSLGLFFLFRPTEALHALVKMPADPARETRMNDVYAPLRRS